MKIIIDTPDGIYGTIADSIEEVEIELKSIINQFIEKNEEPEYFIFRGDIQYLFWDFVEVEDNGNFHFNQEIKVLELNDWFDYFIEKIEKAKRKFYEDQTQLCNE